MTRLNLLAQKSRVLETKLLLLRCHIFRNRRYDNFITIESKWRLLIVKIKSCSPKPTVLMIARVSISHREGLVHVTSVAEISSKSSFFAKFFSSRCHLHTAFTWVLFSFIVKFANLHFENGPCMKIRVSWLTQIYIKKYCCEPTKCSKDLGGGKDGGGKGLKREEVKVTTF